MGPWTVPLASYLNISGQRLVCVLEAVPVLAAKREGHPRQAEGTVFGYLRVHRLGPVWVRHGQVLIQQLLGYDVLDEEQRGDIMKTLPRTPEKIAPFNVTNGKHSVMGTQPTNLDLRLFLRHWTWGRVLLLLLHTFNQFRFLEKLYLNKNIIRIRKTTK